MNERERAAYYQEHKDNLDEWEEVVETPPTRKRDGLTVTVAVRFSAPEAEALSRTARREGKTYSEIIRTAVQRYAEPAVVLDTGQPGVVLNFDGGMSLTQSGIGNTPIVVVGPPVGSETRSSVAQLPAR